MGEHRHPALVEQFTVLEGALSILEIWWTRRDSNPRSPRCEQWGKKAKARRHNHLATFTKPLNGKPGKPVFFLSFQCRSTVRSRMKSRVVPVIVRMKTRVYTPAS